MRSFCIIFLLLLSFQTAMAVRAYPYPIQVRQPDGSTMTILLHGDEFFHYATTVDGRHVRKGPDGFFRTSGADMPGAVAMSMQREKNIGRLQASGGIPVLSTVVTGQIKALVIPVEFPDVKFSVPDPQAHFHNMLNAPGYSENGATGSAVDYFKANLPEKNFVFDVTAPVTLSRSYAYYGENDISTPSVITYDARISEMVEEACSLVNGSVDFSQYDNDKDGNVDYIFLYFAGYNEAESGDENAIWPQTYNISSSGLRFDGVRLGLFACSSELSGSDLGMEAIPSGIGTFCHEFSHFLGLVDLYDTDHGSGGISKCLWGTLSIMDAGNYNNYGRTPPYFCAIDRELAGSAEYMEVKTGTTVSLEAINLNGTVIRIPTATTGEYYLIENRQESGWDSYIGGAGMVVYHIDKSDNIVDGITASVRWRTGLINNYAPHECADLVEAMPDAENIQQVFFPGQADIKEFSAAGDPAFIAWNGIPIGIKFTNIAQNSGVITFDIIEDNTEILLTPTNCHIKAFQNKAIAEWECGRPGNYPWSIIWGRTDISSTAVRDTSYSCRYTFNNLEPRAEYRCMIFHIGKQQNGDTVALHFSTSALTSPYPYIVLDKRSYSKGDTLDLALNNLTEDLSSCIWYINGNRVTTDRYIFKTVGTYKIQAVLVYAADGSNESITRTLHVKEAVLPENDEDF